MFTGRRERCFLGIDSNVKILSEKGYPRRSLTMESGELVLLRCRITRGGFSGERVFRLMQADPVEEYVGAAPVDYCFHLDRRPIGIEEPGKGQPIEGLVTGRIIENGGSLVRVLFPDGETVLMTTSQIAYRRKTDYVPVGS